MSAITALAVCQDVLDRLNAHALTVAMGSGYIVPELIPSYESIEWARTIDEIEKTCRVCALGAATLSLLRLNGVEIPVTLDQTRKIRYDELAPLFGQDNLTLIEAAFEVDASFADEEVIGSDLANAAEAFGSNYDDDEDRLRAIMENCVAHNATFTPPEV